LLHCSRKNHCNNFWHPASGFINIQVEIDGINYTSKAMSKESLKAIAQTIRFNQ
jgi:hypothetical protein